MYKLNIYAPIMLLDDEKTYVFYEPAGLNNQNRTLEMMFTADKKELLNILLSKGALNRAELCFLFGEESTNKLISYGIIIEGENDESITSRSKAFYEQYGLNDVENTLSKKSVLILGCGGIGTHVAWQMVAMGIGKMKLVDYDTIELSNLNRQILYTKNDIKKYKSKILAENVEKINSCTLIEYENRKIETKDDLKSICTEKKYDLIIKALDTPTKLPLWLDQICKEYKIPYVTGLTFKNEVMIGPSYVYGISSVGWSDLIDVEELGEKIFGTVSSIGIALNFISSEISIEAFKILTGHGELKYTDKIKVCNFIENKSRYITLKKCDATVFRATYSKLILNFILIIFLSIFISYNNWLFIIGFISCFLLPVIIYDKKDTAIKVAGLNSISLQIFLFTFNIETIVQYFLSANLIQSAIFIIVIFVILSICSILSCALANLLRYKDK